MDHPSGTHDDHESSKTSSRRRFLKWISLAAVLASLNIPLMIAMLRRIRRRRTFARCIGPFKPRTQVPFELLQNESELVESVSFQVLSDSETRSAELAFLFKGPESSRDLSVNIDLLSQKGDVLFRKNLVCTDGRRSAEPVFMYGRMVYGSPYNTESFNIPVGPEQIAAVEVTFTEL